MEKVSLLLWQNIHMKVNFQSDVYIYISYTLFFIGFETFLILLFSRKTITLIN